MLQSGFALFGVLAIMGPPPFQLLTFAQDPGHVKRGGHRVLLHYHGKKVLVPADCDAWRGPGGLHSWHATLGCVDIFASGRSISSTGADLITLQHERGQSVFLDREAWQYQRWASRVAVQLLTWNGMEDPSVVMAYGNLLEELVKTVPDGVAPWHEVDHHRQRRGTYKFVHNLPSCLEVCFFTSYRYLEQVLEKWYETGDVPGSVRCFSIGMA